MRLTLGQERKTTENCVHCGKPTQAGDRFFNAWLGGFQCGKGGLPGCEEGVRWYADETVVVDDTRYHKSDPAVGGAGKTEQPPHKDNRRWHNFCYKGQVINESERAEANDLAHDLTSSEWTYAKNYFDHCCAYCGQKVDRLVIEHFIPVSEGGGTTCDNVVPACTHCNSSKRAKNAFAWMSKRVPEDRQLKIVRYLESMESHRMVKLSNANVPFRPYQKVLR